MTSHAPVAASLLIMIGAAACEREPQPTAAPSGAATPRPPATPDRAPPAAAGESGGEVVVAGFTFPVPEDWRVVPPANQMRLAELHVPDESGAQPIEVVFSTAGGSVDANIERWVGQVRGDSGGAPRPDVEKFTVDGVPVTIVEITGAYSGMAGMGEQVREAWMLRGAIVEGPQGLLFIKMTGPLEPMAAAGPDFRGMVEGLSRE